MKKRITIIAATVALLTLTAASSAAAGSVFGISGSGVLVRHDDGYIITGRVRDVDLERRRHDPRDTDRGDDGVQHLSRL